MLGPQGRLVQTLENLTTGMSRWASGSQLENAIRQLHASIRMTPGGAGMGMFANAMGMAPGAAAGAGLHPSFGFPLAMSSMAYQNAWMNRGGFMGGFGAAGPGEMAGRDLRLTAQAAASPVANRAGAILEMQRAGVLPAGLAAFAKQVAEGNRAAIMELADPKKFWKKMTDAGLDRSTIQQHLQDTAANQRSIQEHNLHDSVRSVQGEVDMRPRHEAMIQTSLAGSLHGKGVPREVIAKAARAVESKLIDLANRDPEMLTDRKRMDLIKVLAGVVEGELGKDAAKLDHGKMREIIATAVHKLDNYAIAHGTNLGQMYGEHSARVLDEKKRHQLASKAAAAIGGRHGGGGGAVQPDAARAAADAIKGIGGGPAGPGGVPGGGIAFPSTFTINGTLTIPGLGRGEVGGNAKPDRHGMPGK
jgi:hypothetical protein